MNRYAHFGTLSVNMTLKTKVVFGCSSKVPNGLELLILAARVHSAKFFIRWRGGETSGVGLGRKIQSMYSFSKCKTRCCKDSPIKRNKIINVQATQKLSDRLTFSVAVGCACTFRLRAAAWSLSGTMLVVLTRLGL